MNATPKAWWSALALAAILGCAGEEAPTAKPPVPTPPVTPAKPAQPKIEPDAPKVEAPKKDEAPKVEGPKADAPKVEGPKADAKPAAKLTDDEIAEIKKLPADEAALALKQAICPVSDEHLGEMGMPLKVTAEGKTFFLCCKSCEKEVKADPKAVVAKLAK